MDVRSLRGGMAAAGLFACVAASAMELPDDGEPVDLAEVEAMRAQAACAKGTPEELAAWIGIYDLGDEAEDDTLRREALARIAALAEKHPSSPEAQDAASALGFTRLVAPEAAEKALRRIVGKGEPAARGTALLSLATTLARMEMTPERLGEIMSIRDRIEKEFAGQVSCDAVDHWLDRFGGFTGETPDFDAADADGKRFKLSDFRGKVTAVIFWAYWCKPCMADMPHEIEVAKRFKERPFAVVGVNADKGAPAELKARFEKTGIPWRNALDGGHAGPIVTKWGVKGWPTVLVLDAAGKVRYVDARGEDLDRAVEALLAEKR